MANGIINLLKPPGVSSGGAVGAIKNIFGQKKVGHTGTLDPNAAGVLPVCLGRSTRLAELITAGEKEYIAEIAFGLRTDTQDSTGKILEQSDTAVSEAQLLNVLPRFTGHIEQVTPAYSAAKQNGVPLYKLARQGKEAAGKTREVLIRAIEYLGQTAASRFLLRITCGKGTYIRTLCEDLGQALGVPAYMAFLLRTRVAKFCIEEAWTLDELRALQSEGRLGEALKAPDDALHTFEALDLPEEYENKLLNGSTVYIEGSDIRPGQYRVYCGGRFTGLGLVEGGAVKIATLLWGN